MNNKDNKNNKFVKMIETFMTDLENKEYDGVFADTMILAHMTILAERFSNNEILNEYQMFLEKIGQMIIDESEKESEK